MKTKLDGPTRIWILTFGVATAARFGALGIVGTDSALETAHHEHASIAKNLAEGRGFRFNFFGQIDKPLSTSQQAPVVPGFLAGCYLLLGIESRSALLAAVGVQILIGAATAAGMALVAWFLRASPVYASVVGILVAGYPPIVVASLHLQALPWNLFWLTHLLLFTLQSKVAGGKDAWLASIGFTICAVGGILTDPIAAATVGLLWLWSAIALTIDHAPGRQRRALVVAVAIALGLTPWLYRNFVVHRRFVFVKDSFWYVFWQGNNPHSAGTDKLPVPVGEANSLRKFANARDNLEATKTARRKALSVDSTLSVDRLRLLESKSSEIARMDQFREWAVDDLRQDGAHYMRMCWRRLWIWLWFDDTNPRSFLWQYRLSYLSLAVLAGVGLPSVWRERVQWTPVLLCAFAMTTVHVLVIGSARFRVPLELLLALPAAIPVATVLSKWQIQQSE